MRAEFDVNLTESDLFRFSLHHSYAGMQGKISILLGILAFVMAGLTWGDVEPFYTLVYIVVGIGVIVYIPGALRLSAKRQYLLGEALQKPIHYVIDEQGISTRSELEEGVETGVLPWEEVYKMQNHKQYLYIYSTRVCACIIPLDALGEQYTTVKELGKKKLASYRYCIRR